MSQYQRLLVLVEQQARPSPAFTRAVALARATGATLHVASFVDYPPTLLERGTLELDRPDYLNVHRELLRALVEPLQAEGLPVSSQAVWSEHRLQDILECVGQLDPHLVIKDVHQEPAIKRAFITPLDWRLLRDCPVPVHLVAGAEHALPRKVIAAVDPSNSSEQSDRLNERIIHEANALALQCGAELHLLHAGDLTPHHLIATNAAGAGFGEGFVDKARQQLEHRFADLANRYGVPAGQRHLVLGPPLTTLADFAEQSGADVLVMGVVRRRGVDNLLGSTTEHLLYRVPCSIIGVKL